MGFSYKWRLTPKERETMKIIEAMNAIKMGNQKMADLSEKIGSHSAHLSHETPVYQDTTAQIREWQQSFHDQGKENVRLLVAIQRTNLATKVAIKIGDKMVEKTIAEWVWRRREYAAKDLLSWESLTDRKLREGRIPSSIGEPMDVKIVRNFDPKVRDTKVLEFKQEPQLIDSALEVVNATTDLLE